MFVGNELNGLFFLLCFLATFRVATLFSMDLGPMHVFWHIREFLKNRSESIGEHRHDEFWRTATFKQRLWRSAWELFDCQYCFGLWVAMAIPTVFPLWLIVILAVAGAQSLVHRVVRVLQSQNDVLEQALKLSRELEK